MAEGFEPSRELPPYTLSRRVPSAARAGLRAGVYGWAGGLAAAILRPEELMGEIEMVAVDPGRQDHGLGTELTNVATDWMRREGMTHAVIATGGDLGHAPARRTYEKAGYKPFPGVNYFKAL